MRNLRDCAAGLRDCAAGLRACAAGLRACAAGLLTRRARTAGHPPAPLSARRVRRPAALFTFAAALLAVATALLGVIVLLLIAGLAQADTGTYRIQEYRVKLTPLSSGQVRIEYHQKWLVTGGGIPWITVGVAGPNFTIATPAGGAMRKLSSEVGGSWCGVRIELDRNYTPGQTFEADFTILQNGLLYVDKDAYRLDFTPGWYDAAAIDNLAVEMFFFAPVEKVTAQPAPTQKEGQRFIWQFAQVGPGQRRSISVSFPKNFFPVNVAVASRTSGSGGDVAWFEMCGVVLVVAIFFIVFIYLFIRFSVGTGYGRGGTIFVPGGHAHGGPHDRGVGGGLGGIFSGGGGGFGGASSSCACACAGCACACACAGGGAAGCDRKVKFTCPLCRACPAACPLSWGRRP